MKSWLRNLVMLVVIAVWALFMVGSYLRHDDISEFLWGVPGGVYIVLNPTWKRGDSDDGKTSKKV